MAGMNFSVNIYDYTNKNKFDVSKANQMLAETIKDDTEPYVPMYTGNLIERTYVENEKIVYPGPYARYLYYGKAMIDSKTGKGPFHWIDKLGVEYFRYKKGSTLIPSDKELEFFKFFHPYAQAYWLEASKAQNISKWRDDASKIVKNTKAGFINSILKGFKKR